MPVIEPVEVLIDRPAGRPVADQVRVAPDWESVAELATAVMAVPVTADLLPGLATATVLVTVQVNEVGAEVARTVGGLDGDRARARRVVGVPVIAPVEVLIDSPAGRPVADQVRVAPDWESVAELVTAVMAVPVTVDWLPGLATVTVLVTFQVNDAVAVSAWESVAVTVTEQAQGVVGVPLTTPPDEIDSPAGRPVAVYVTELPPVVSWLPVMVRPEMADPDTFDWVPGLVTDRTSTFHVSVMEPAVPAAPVPPPAEPAPYVMPEP